MFNVKCSMSNVLLTTLSIDIDKHQFSPVRVLAESVAMEFQISTFCINPGHCHQLRCAHGFLNPAPHRVFRCATAGSVGVNNRPKHAPKHTSRWPYSCWLLSRPGERT